MQSHTFTDVLDRTRTLLEADAALGSFCPHHWGKSLTAEIRYRARREIAFSELPIVLITRPQVSNRKGVRHGREGLHTIHLYAGFMNNDAAAGALELVRFEELIEDALTVGNPFADLALDAAVGDSINDEGAAPPAFFTAMQLHVLYQRKT